MRFIRRWRPSAASPKAPASAIHFLREAVVHFPLVWIAQGRAPSRKSQIKRREAFEARLVIRRGDVADRDHETAHARVGKFLQAFLHLRAFALDCAGASNVELREVATDGMALLLKFIDILLHI